MVNHDILFEKMKQKNITTEIIEGVKMMFNNLVIPTDQENIHIGRGLGQGWVISCLLFNIFTDDLTDEFIKEGNIFPQIFADDTNIVGNDITKLKNTIRIGE